MGILAETYREPSVQDLRIHRMKHLRVDGTSFADMVPILVAEGLIPEHGNHSPDRATGNNRRSVERRAEICGHCEHLIHEHWKRNIVNLSADEAVLLDARFLWINRAARQIVRYETLAVAPVITTTTTRRKIEAAEGAEDNDAYVIETTTKEVRSTSPTYFRMADELRAHIARLAGVPVGDLSRVPAPQAAGRGKKQLVVRDRNDADEQRDEPAN
jgi:hypothetical protein